MCIHYSVLYVDTTAGMDSVGHEAGQHPVKSYFLLIRGTEVAKKLCISASECFICMCSCRHKNLTENFLEWPQNPPSVEIGRPPDPPLGTLTLHLWHSLKPLASRPYPPIMICRSALNWARVHIPAHFCGKTFRHVA